MKKKDVKAVIDALIEGVSEVEYAYESSWGAGKEAASVLFTEDNIVAWLKETRTDPLFLHYLGVVK